MLKYSTFPGRGRGETSHGKESLLIAAFRFDSHLLRSKVYEHGRAKEPFYHLPIKRYALFGPLQLCMGALCRCKPSPLCQCLSSCLRNDANQMRGNADGVYIYKMGLCAANRRASSRSLERAMRIINYIPLRIVPWWSAAASAMEFIIRADSMFCSYPVSHDARSLQDDMDGEVSPMDPLSTARLL